ncbi:MAG: ABC transporter permease [Deltaproteobacteria bacterium]|nr:ABC transporter permease [Deltaproteobacteria bacterium]
MQNTYQTVIRAGRPWWHIDWRELWEYRDLLRLMVKRDLTAIYKQTILGPAWFIIQPLLTTIVFTIIFGKVAKVSTDGIPQFVFYMSGTVMWNYFQGCMNQSGNSLINSANILSKVYFPRLVIPLSAVFTNLAHFLLNMVMFFGFYTWFFCSTPSMRPTTGIVFFPLLIFQCALIGLGVGLWVAALTIKYRDLKFALPFLTQLWMYGTPIVYPASLIISPKWRMLLWSNPMSFVVEATRWMFTGTGTISLIGGVISIAMTLFILISGLFLFNLVQRTFVDTI